ncbi:MAG: hypothetical protein ABIA04_00765 [Pseudomonadota bacterium]
MKNNRLNLEDNKKPKNESRREFLKKAILATAIATPMVQTFKIKELRADPPSWSMGMGGNPMGM